MKILFVLVLFFGWGVQGKDLICNQVGQPHVSELKVSYDGEGSPVGLSLRSPQEEMFRPLAVGVEVVSAMDFKGHESFVSKPIVPEIDWDNEVQCFKEMGTMMYFLFWHFESQFFVELYPFIVTEYPSCVPPHFQPQRQMLSCQWQ